MSNPESSATSSADFEVDSNPAETSTLFSVIDRDKVFGLNLTVPEDAKELIKPWNERESVDKWVDSGVDDQVRIHIKLPKTKFSPFTTSTPSAHHTRTFHSKCQNSKYSIETRSVFLPFSRNILPYSNPPTVLCFQHEETYAHIDSGFTPTFLME